MRVRERLLTIHLLYALRRRQEYADQLKLEIQAERKEPGVMFSENLSVFQGETSPMI